MAGISTGGKFFFGGLTAGTFGLGCWQIQRYFEKMDQMEVRAQELSQPPMTYEYVTSLSSPMACYHRKLLQGKWLHSKEVLIGPRGAPPTAANVDTSGGMGPSPQGFMVLTPLQMIDGNLVWVNRGWVPKAMVPGADPRGGRASKMASPEDVNNWDRPEDIVDVIAIQSKPEQPKLIAIDHDYSKRPLQLFWMDGVALQAIAESDQETVLLTQVDTAAESTDAISSKKSTSYPQLPALERIAEFKTTPTIHAGYAATWYGLSAAGIFMTRKLITRGRG